MELTNLISGCVTTWTASTSDMSGKQDIRKNHPRHWAKNGANL
jgi:hypothetical protein